MNSQLYGNTYEIPEYLLKIIKAKIMTTSNNNGIRRAKNIINSGSLTYQQMKRIKNFYDNISSKDEMIQFDVIGGNVMKKFIEKTLNSERTRTANSKKIMEPIKVSLNDPTVKAQTGHVKLTEENNIQNSNLEENKLNLNTLICIFDSEMRILILKRSTYPDQWMPNKLCLVGGAVESGEVPMLAAKRETYEETGIKLDVLKEIFVIQRDKTNVEHLFVTKLPNRYDTYNIKLDKENDGYLWLNSEELKKIDKPLCVPNLLDYIRIAATKYSD